jgi:nitroreductase
VEIIKEITERRAKRAIADTQIERDIIRRILDAAMLAPSCANKQSWRFLVVDEKTGIEAVSSCLTEGNYWARKPGAFILAITKPGLGSVLDDRREYALFDTGLACMNLMLQATKEGLIAHPIAGYLPVKAKTAFAIPEDYILIAIIVLGYPGDITSLNEKHKAAETSPRSRRPIEESVCFNKWTL